MIDGGENGVSSFRMGSRDPLYPACPVWIATTFPSRRARAAEPVSGGEKGKGTSQNQIRGFGFPGTGPWGPLWVPAGGAYGAGGPVAILLLRFRHFPFSFISFPPAG